MIRPIVEPKPVNLNQFLTNNYKG